MGGVGFESLAGTRPSAGTLVHELITSGVVSLADVVSRGLELEERSMSHVGYRVLIGGEPTVFVKKADPVATAGRDLRTEVAAYRLAASHPALAAAMPDRRFLAEDGSLIVLEAVPGASSDAVALAGGRLGEEIMGQYGRAVAAVHSVRPAPFGEAPWLLSALEVTADSSAALPSAVARLLDDLRRRPEFRTGFGAAGAEWRQEVLIHGDLRWSNLIVAADGDPPRVVLVDWELACLGDPGWDVGSVLADLLLSLALAPTAPPTSAALVETATPFLVGYVEAFEGQADWRAFLVRSVRLAAVRIVQTIAEYGYVDESEMATIEAMLLPWSADFLGDPEPLAASLATAVPT